MRFFEFLLNHATELGWALWRHIALVALSTGTALLLGVPLGIVAFRRPRWGMPLLGFANVVQTIPSLAMFGFLIPIPFIGGIGVKTALLVLILYALLPVMRGTMNGLQNVDKGLREAALALGMTEGQTLRYVELPLARPAIMTGLRVATVVGVGTATIAAAIGAGGLGEFIFRGVASVDSTVILAGTIPAALLALLADFGLGRIEKRVAPGHQHKSNVGLRLFVGFTLATLLAFAGWFWLAELKTERIVIGSKSFTEQVILGELLAQVIERNTTLAVTRKFNLGDTLVCETALLAGDLDAYIEYTGTALTAIFKQPIQSDSDEVNRSVAAAYSATGRTMLAPLGFNNTFVILVRQADAQQFGLKTISDAAQQSARWRAGFGAAFLDREDGYRGLTKTYGFQFAAPPLAMDVSLTYRALAEKQIDLIAGDATNGLIAKLGLVALADDRHYFPPYHAVPIIRTQTLQRYPQLGPALGQLADALSDTKMQQMNYQADVEHRDASAIVQEFLKRPK